MQRHAQRQVWQLGVNDSNVHAWLSKGTMERGCYEQALQYLLQLFTLQLAAAAGLQRGSHPGIAAAFIWRAAASSVCGQQLVMGRLQRVVVGGAQLTPALVMFRLCALAYSSQGLASSTARQQLGLTYYSGSQQAAAAAVTWRQLPQLCELSLCYMYPYPSRRQWQAIVNGMAASTNLTKLDLHAACSGSGEHHDDEDEDGLGNSFCAELAGLTNLKHLCISYGVAMLAPGDALALTALTRLTHLNLGFNLAGVGDEAATALAGSCQQLCHLNLRCCNLVSMACLASVAHLTQPTRLWLAGNSGLSQQGLMLLTGLKRLQSLHVDTNAEVTDEVVERLWAAVRGQQLGCAAILANGWQAATRQSLVEYRAGQRCRHVRCYSLLQVPFADEAAATVPIGTLLLSQRLPGVRFGNHLYKPRPMQSVDKHPLHTKVRGQGTATATMSVDCRCSCSGCHQKHRLCLNMRTVLRIVCRLFNTWVCFVCVVKQVLNHW
ncbi:hypothetical protein COO60DRAFT_1628761, partial [Scenedesmus sp. NREL 46B-D3]